MQTGLRLAYAPGMTRTFAFWLALLPALPFLLPLPIASAQTAGTSGSVTGGGSIAAVLTKIGSEPYTDTSYMIPVSKKDCDSNAELHFTLNNIPTGYKYLEVWVGENCAIGTRATRVGEALCELVLDKEQDVTNTVDTDFTVPVMKACALGDGNRSIWVLAVTSENGSMDATAYAKITLTFDTTPPSPPGSVKGGAGQTEIPVSWTQPSDSYYFWVVVDTNVSASDADVDAGSGSECTSKLLQPDAEFDPDQDPLPDGVWVKYINEKASKATLSADDLGITEGQAAVAVMAGDRGRNHSKLSNIACLDIVPTTGFCGKYREAGGAADAGCACTVPGMQRRDAHLGWAVLLGFGLLGVWRRAQRRA
jgi:hypothetical protein